MSYATVVSLLGNPAFFDRFSVLLTKLRKDNGFGREWRPSLLMVPFPGRISPMVALIWCAQTVACVLMTCVTYLHLSD